MRVETQRPEAAVPEATVWPPDIVPGQVDVLPTGDRWVQQLFGKVPTESLKLLDGFSQVDRVPEHNRGNNQALEPAVRARTPKKQPVRKAGSKAKAEAARQKGGEAELAKERRRAGRVGRQKAPSSGVQRGEKGRGSPGR